MNYLLFYGKVKGGLSAGRVQSVSVRLIVEKEREITAFTPEASYKVDAIFTNSNGKSFKAKLAKGFKSKEEAFKFLEANQSSSFKIESLEKKPVSKYPSAPFTTLYTSAGSIKKVILFC